MERASRACIHAGVSTEDAGFAIQHVQVEIQQRFNSSMHVKCELNERVERWLNAGPKSRKRASKLEYWGCSN